MSNTGNTEAKRTSAKTGRWILALAIIGIAGGVYVLRPAAGEDRNAASDSAATVTTATAAATESAPATTGPLPRLIDLGADKCVPCKMMAPILDQMRTDYAGKLQVDFIDVWKTPDAGKPYNIKLIPTQIFMAPDGTELHRHEGFISREDILAKWTELGYAL